MMVKSSINFCFLWSVILSPTMFDLVGARSTMHYLFSLDLLLLTPKTERLISNDLAVLAFAPGSFDTSFPHLEALVRISSIFSFFRQDCYM